jgi:hypothetical protein
MCNTRPKAIHNPKPENCPNCGSLMELLDYFIWHHVKQCGECIGPEEQRKLAEIRRFV